MQWITCIVDEPRYLGEVLHTAFEAAGLILGVCPEPNEANFLGPWGFLFLSSKLYKGGGSSNSNQSRSARAPTGSSTSP